MINAGKYNKRIKICQVQQVEDSQGFQVMRPIDPPVWSGFAEVKTTRGMTLIVNNSDFEKAYTNFTIRYPVSKITRDMVVVFRDVVYEIEYLNNINEMNIELEIQAKEVTH